MGATACCCQSSGNKGGDNAVVVDVNLSPEMGGEGDKSYKFDALDRVGDSLHEIAKPSELTALVDSEVVESAEEKESLKESVLQTESVMQAPKCISSMKTNADDMTPEPTGVKLVFDDSGREQVVYTEYQPLGLLFDKELPIIISEYKATSYGKTIGIKLGWTLLSVNDESFSELADFQEAMDIMQKHIGVLKKVPPERASPKHLD